MDSLESLFSLRGHVGLVTGASSGLGVECAHALAIGGAAVAVVARRADRIEALAAELQADVKQRSVHLLLLDLGRNDVGRVAKTGSLHVPIRMAVERYSHVMHIVSNVTGRLRPGMTPIAALRATFPAGTLSGAPKIRAMEIIDELEPVKRGIYGGAVGFL